MKTRLIGFALAIGLGLIPLASFAQKNSCLECHKNLEGELKAPAECSARTSINSSA